MNHDPDNDIIRVGVLYAIMAVATVARIIRRDCDWEGEISLLWLVTPQAEEYRKLSKIVVSLQPQNEPLGPNFVKQ